mmetsp:Transcript_15885/g.40521  ORF Transcript_15885/g.40521 Transcript_15885/m.40521 type:complete len:205 (+) Transcript_15885:361-975(+)
MNRSSKRSSAKRHSSSSPNSLYLFSATCSYSASRSGLGTTKPSSAAAGKTGSIIVPAPTLRPISRIASDLVRADPSGSTTTIEEMSPGWRPERARSDRPTSDCSAQNLNSPRTASGRSHWSMKSTPPLQRVQTPSKRMTGRASPLKTKSELAASSASCEAGIGAETVVAIMAIAWRATPVRRGARATAEIVISEKRTLIISPRT